MSVSRPRPSRQPSVSHNRSQGTWTSMTTRKSSSPMSTTHSFHCIHAHILSICTYLLVSHVIVCRVLYSYTSRFYICMMHPQVELYIPDEVGCEHILPDGVRLMVRLRLDTETDPRNHRYVPEWMLPDRRPSTLHCTICICALAMYTHPHRLSISL